MNTLVPQLPTERERLLENLRLLRPVTPDVSDALADHMGIRRGEVAETATFYAYLGLPTDTVRVCTGPVCDSRGGRALLREGAVEVACLGHCDVAPVAMAGETVVPLASPDLLERVLAGARAPAVAHRCNDGDSTGLARADATLADYAHRGGLDALRRLPPPGEVIAELAASGLHGRGGAGFPTARKWEYVRAEPGPRVVVVNADEGEPGTIKDRYVMERRPHLLLEGLLIAMRTVGADSGYVYLRDEYTTARARLHDAIEQLRDAGFLDGVTVEVVNGAGSYVCGEETALLESMEGRRGEPRLRPPFPAQSGYLGRPTLVNNVETLAHVPAIVRNGGAWFAALGTPRLWSVSGCVRTPGCYEARSDVSAGELIATHGGGATDEIGAFVPGGAASGILPPAALDVPLTNEALAEWGASPGSAALQVFPTSYPVLRLLSETMRFFAEESCQKCTPCRLGTRALKAVVDGELAMPRERLDRWLDALERASICGLGQSVPLPLRAARRYWPQEMPWAT